MKIKYNGRPNSTLFFAVAIFICWAVAGNASESWDAEATARVNLRNRPSTKGTILSVIPKGHNVSVTEQKGNWCKVDVEGEIYGKGWVYGKYLKKIVINVKDKDTLTVPFLRATSMAAPMAQSSVGSDLRDSENEGDALTTMEILTTVEPRNTVSAQEPLQGQMEEEKTYSLNAPLSEKSPIAGLDEQVLERKQLRDPKNKAQALSQVEIPLTGEAVPLSLTQSSTSGDARAAIGDSGTDASGGLKPADSAIDQKPLLGDKNKHSGPAKGFSTELQDLPVSDTRPVGFSTKRSAISAETREPITRRGAAGSGLLEIALKLLSIILSCFVVLMLYKGKLSNQNLKYSSLIDFPKFDQRVFGPNDQVKPLGSPMPFREISTAG